MQAAMNMFIKKELRTIALAAIAIAAPAALHAQVHFVQEKSKIDIEINGKPFGIFYVGSEFPKPFVAPLRSASGKVVTRQFPMAESTGESTDHRHHRGMWLGYKEVNGFNFWENEFSYHNKLAGKIVLKKLIKVKGGKNGVIHATFDWIDPSDKVVLTETRTMTFYSDRELRKIDFDVTLTAVQKTVFGDDKDGTFAVRLADPLIEKGGSGTMINAAGKKGMKDVWGKPSNWVDYSGELNGEKLGVAIFEHPDSFHHPTRWHSRDYGLFAANPFAAKSFDESEKALETELEPGKSVHLRYMVVIHPEMDAEALGKLYQQYSALK
jgi:hypothetical protein